MNEADVKYLEQPAELDEASRLLLKAADLIETRGHCKHTLKLGDAMCANGALNFAISGNALSMDHWEQGPVFLRLRQALGCEIPAWNNAPERTSEEVVSTMRRVALGG